MQLSDRVALVTGGKRIGFEVALAFAGRGADVGLVYRGSRTEAEDTARAVMQLGRRAELIQADLTVPANCRRAVADTVGALGRLDVLVNMASVYASKPYLDSTDDDWDRSLAVDSRFSAPLRAGGCAPTSIRRRRAHRQFQRLDRQPAPPVPVRPYYVAKMGVIALTEALALELHLTTSWSMRSRRVRSSRPRARPPTNTRQSPRHAARPLGG